MAYLTGTATDAEDLIAQFRTFITSSSELASESPSQVWVEEKYVANVGSDYELYLRGPGLDASDNIHVNVNLFKDTAAGTDAWTWRMRGATSFAAGLSYDNQPGTHSFSKNMPIWDQAIPFYFFANGRRFIIICQITASVQTNCYGGFLLPFAPSVAALEYRYPLYIGASMANVGLRFSSTLSPEHRSFWNPGNDDNLSRGTSAIYSPGNQWVELTNYNTSGTQNSSVLQDDGSGQTSPYHRASFASDAALATSSLQPLFGGSYLLTDVLVTKASQNSVFSDTYGTLDGVAHVSGVGQSPGNTVTLGAETYTVFQEAFRTDTGDFVAIRQ